MRKSGELSPWKVENVLFVAGVAKSGMSFPGICEGVERYDEAEGSPVFVVVVSVSVAVSSVAVGSS